MKAWRSVWCWRGRNSSCDWLARRVGAHDVTAVETYSRHVRGRGDKVGRVSAAGNLDDDVVSIEV